MHSYNTELFPIRSCWHFGRVIIPCVERGMLFNVPAPQMLPVSSFLGHRTAREVPPSSAPQLAPGEDPPLVRNHWSLKKKAMI